MSFSPRELQRYQRHLSLAGFGVEAQQKLKRSSVLVIGAGGLGCPALLYLAAAGVGRIVIIDDDRVDISNLQRQVLYTEADAGQLKVEAAARRLRALNPSINIEPRAERFIRANALDLVRSVDVVIDGSDNFPTRYLVNDACVLAGRPFVYGAIQGFEGQLSVFNWSGGPTYRCLFPEPPAAGAVPNCAEAGVLGVLPGLIGAAQACEAIKLLTGIGESLSGRLFLWDALMMTTHSVALTVDPRSRDICELPPEGYGETCLPSIALAKEGILRSSIEEIDVSRLLDRLGYGQKQQFIDVRQSWERSMHGVIEPSVHLPLDELEKGAVHSLTQLDPSMPTVVYCASGVRSLRGAQLLRERHGFHHAVSLRGGFKAWHARHSR
ncbi:MAG: molybdopterin-synthase adenylyltransferase MoeB [Verrucomicrobiota bacterium]|nr:molybdopterin-synthase adenylyltransferase MoeB [Verrucomicrobiota bacterium]